MVNLEQKPIGIALQPQFLRETLICHAAELGIPVINLLCPQNDSPLIKNIFDCQTIVTDNIISRKLTEVWVTRYGKKPKASIPPPFILLRNSNGAAPTSILVSPQDIVTLGNIKYLYELDSFLRQLLISLS